MSVAEDNHRVVARAIRTAFLPAQAEALIPAVIQGCPAAYTPTGTSQVHSSLEMFREILLQILQYLATRTDPVRVAQETQALARAFATRSDTPCDTWESNAVYIEDTAAVQCSAKANWFSLANTPENVEGFSYTAGLYTPRVQAGDHHFLVRQIHLAFMKDDTTTLPCIGMQQGVRDAVVTTPAFRRVKRPVAGMMVNIGFGGERRGTTPSMKQALAHVAPKRVYLPTEPLTAKALQVAVQDIYAALAVYLVQGGFVCLEEDPVLYRFLLTYVTSYKYVRELGSASVLGEILGFRHRHTPPEEASRMPRYFWPEDYRSFRKYVRRTILGMKKTADRPTRSFVVQDPTTQTDHFLVPAVADRLGISQSTVYRWINQGKVLTEEVGRDGVPYTTIPHAEIERLQRQQDAQKREHQAFYRLYAQVKGVPIPTARRWVQRQLKQGFLWQDIRQKGATLFQSLRDQEKEE